MSRYQHGHVRMSAWRTAGAVVAAVAAGLVVAACGSDDGGGGSGAPAKVVGATTKTDALYEAAKKEGTVVWHVGFDTEEASGLVSAFEKAYPGIKVQVVSVSEPALPAKLTTESAAGKVSIDVAMGRTDTLKPLLDRDILETEDWTKLGDVKPENVMLDNRLRARLRLRHRLVLQQGQGAGGRGAGEVDDLLDPKWGGRKMLIQANGSVGLEGLVMSGQWTADDARAFLSKMANQKVISEQRGTPIVTKVGTGQYPLGVAPITVVPGAIKDGAPLQLLPLGPLVALPNGVFEVKHAAHPNAAKLLITWLGSSASKPEWDKLGRGDVTHCEDSELAKLMCAANLEVVEADTIEKAAQVEEVAKIGREELGVHED